MFVSVISVFRVKQIVCYHHVARPLVADGTEGLQMLKAAANIRGRVQKFPEWFDNEISNNNKHSMRSNTKDCGGETHYTNSQNNDTTTLSGRELCHFQFLLHVASPETFGYTVILNKLP
jgi:hypothetical protein